MEKNTNSIKSDIQKKHSNQKKSGNFKKRNTIILIIIAVMVAAGAILYFTSKQASNAKKAFVEITLQGQVYKVVPINGEEQLITIEQSNGSVNDIKITADGAYMEHSTCSNQDCVQQGTVTLNNYATRVLGGWIICLPNQVSIELIAEEVS